MPAQNARPTRSLVSALSAWRPGRRTAALATVVLASWALVGLARQGLVFAPSQGPSAGLRDFRFTVATLPRPIDGSVWYPAEAGTAERPILYSSAAWGRAAMGAPLANGEKKPLIILAHGWRGTRYDFGWLGEQLAHRGYVAASLDMPEVDAKTFDDAQAPKVWYRAKLLRGLMDAVAKMPALAARADMHHVIVIGHSAGGSAAFMLGGATLDPQRFNNLFPLSAPVVDGDWDDERLQAIIALNPGTGPAFSAAGLKHVRVPSLILSGTGDTDAPEASNAGYYAKYVPRAQWLSFANVNHYTLFNDCTLWARLRGFGSCKEASPTVVRELVHQKALVAIVSFLDGLAKPSRRGR